MYHSELQEKLPSFLKPQTTATQDAMLTRISRLSTLSSAASTSKLFLVCLVVSAAAASSFSFFSSDSLSFPSPLTYKISISSASITGFLPLLGDLAGPSLAAGLAGFSVSSFARRKGWDIPD